jgi:hypothetical protein
MWKKLIITSISIILLFTITCQKKEQEEKTIEKSPIKLSTSKESYYRFEIVEVFLKFSKNILKDLNQINIRGCVFKDGEVIKSIGGFDTFKLKYDNETDTFIGKWAMDWNPPTGKYWIVILVKDNNQEFFLIEDFVIKRKTPSDKIDIPITAVTLETDTRYSNIKFQGPDGKVGDWHGLVDWAKFMGAGSFWYLTGMTKAMYYPTPENPWRDYNKEFALELGRYAHQKGLKFGAWVGAYLPYGITQPSVGSKFSRNLIEGEFWHTLHFSLDDEKRTSDIIKLLNWMENQPEIDYIGLDYMRTGFGGYELVDDFVLDMGLDVPDDFWDRTLEGRMSWLTYKIGTEKPAYLRMWQWYCASRVAKIVKQIKEQANITKPLWVFTLGWVMGHQHGQDVLMINDAGADFVALMLYEANRGCFDQMMIDWPEYINEGQTNIVIGNCVEERLLDNPYTNPWTTPEEWFDRTSKGMEKIYNDGIVEGVFWHDLDRALIGQGGDDYSVLEFAIMGGTAFTDIKEHYDKINVNLNIKSLNNGIVSFTVENNNKEPINNITVELLKTVGVKPLAKGIELQSLDGETIWEGKIPYKLIARRDRVFVALRLTWGDEGVNEIAFDFVPVQLAK